MSNISFSHIVAASSNHVIGADGGLPWDIPEDMKFFRSTTAGKIIIMGRKTFESVGHPLPKRLNLVVTRQKDYIAEGAIVFSTIEEAMNFAKTKVDDYDPEIFIIGGGEIYKQSLPLVDTVYLTRIHQDIKGDTLYPQLDPAQFELSHQEDRTEPVPFSFLTYKKVSSRSGR